MLNGKLGLSKAAEAVARTKLWRADNPEKHAAQRKRHYAANREKIAERQRLYRASNKERLAARAKRCREASQRVEYKKLWYAAHREEQAARSKVRRAVRFEEIAASNRRYQLANSALYAASCAKHRAAKLQATPLWAEPELIELIYVEATHRGMQVDHIVPLHGKNVCGLHVHNNMQLLTRSQNASKGNRFPHGSGIC